MHSDIGIIGLGVMGKSLAMNMLNHEFKVSGYNRSFSSVQELIDKGYDQFYGFNDLVSFIDSLKSPKIVMLMVPAGEPVDQMIEKILPMLSKGDIIMDGGNSFFRDSERRSVALSHEGIYFYAVGVSGGEKGALLGPSIMPSGDKAIYPIVGKILETIAAKKDGEACCRYIGKLGSGHYVKMVHNGIEYADMQLIAESVLLLKAAGYDNDHISDLIASWNQGPIKSYLLDITVNILKEKEGDHHLVDKILDVSSHKGTGKWTSLQALEQDVNVSLIQAAFMARLMSNQASLRAAFSNDSLPKITIDPKLIHQAYKLGKLIAYAQGFALYQDASDQYGYDLDLEAIATIFRAGCIIQSELLEELRLVFKDEPHLENILLADRFKSWIIDNLEALRTVGSVAVNSGIPTPIYLEAATYLNQSHAFSLGANIIQAQRDYFGAHTFKRIDVEGSYHHEWE